MEREEDQAQEKATQRLMRRLAELEDIENWMKEANTWYKETMQGGDRKQQEGSETIVNELARGHGGNRRLIEKLQRMLRRREEGRNDGEKEEDAINASSNEQKKAESKK